MACSLNEVSVCHELIKLLNSRFLSISIITLLMTFSETIMRFSLLIDQAVTAFLNRYCAWMCICLSELTQSHCPMLGYETTSSYQFRSTFVLLLEKLSFRKYLKERDGYTA